MADLADVEDALVALVAQAAYPAGTGSPSVAGVDVRIGRGWPVPRDLDAALRAGAITITVFPLDAEQKTTRYPKEWYELTTPVVGLTLTATDSTITVGGTPSSPLNAAAKVDGVSHVYPVQPGDTPASIATGLAALIGGASVGPVITIAGAHRVSATVGGFGSVQREIKRQKRSFLVTFWCPDWETRDAVAPPVDAALAGIDFLALADGSMGRIVYERSRVADKDENENLYRRDLVYSVEYPTTETQTAAQVVATPITITQFNPEAP